MSAARSRAASFRSIAMVACRSCPASLLPVVAGVALAVLAGCGGSPESGSAGLNSNAQVALAHVGGFVLETPGRVETDPLLKMSIGPQFEVLRGQAPMNCSVRLLWNGPGLLEGRLLCDFYAGSKYVGSWKSPELAINDQTYVLPLMLPPSPLNDGRVGYAIRAIFQTEDRLIVLDPRDLPAPARWHRQYVMGLIVPESVQRMGGFVGEENSPHASDVFQLAKYHAERNLGSEFSTNTVPVKPVDLPIDPLRMTAFDLIVVSGEALGELRPNQFEALVRWAEAGGRVCLIGTAPIPAPLREGWLRLVNSPQADPAIAIDDDGRLTSLRKENPIRSEPGCGRVLCLTGAVNVDAASWDAEVLWLFGVLDSQVKQIARTGHWKTAPLMQISPQYERIRPFGAAPVPVASFKAPLMPTEVRGVSMGQVLVLLGTCLLLVGPFDYYLLGRLRLRKWTWLFLPIVAVATTWATMRISQSSLGRESYLRSVSIADLSPANNVVRVNRLELEFSAVEEMRKIERDSLIRVDFEPASVGIDAVAEDQQLQWGGNVQAAADPTGAPVRYSGRVPGGYEIWEPMHQWSPRLFRETTFGPDERIDAAPLQAIDWAAIDRLDWRTETGRAQIVERVRAALPEASVLLRSGLETVDCVEPESTVASDGFRMMLFTVAAATSVSTASSDGEPQGLFGMVYQRSPNCGPDLEDLAWLNPEDPDQAVLVIGQPGDHAVIARRKLTAPEQSE